MEQTSGGGESKVEPADEVGGKERRRSMREGKGERYEGRKGREVPSSPVIKPLQNRVPFSMLHHHKVIGLSGSIASKFNKYITLYQ